MDGMEINDCDPWNYFCLICCREIDPQAQKQGSYPPTILDDIFFVLSNYMKWNETGQQFQFDLELFPFCDNCTPTVQSVYELNEQVHNLLRRIDQLCANVSGKILLSQNKCNRILKSRYSGDTSSGPERSQHHFDADKVYSFRNAIYKRFSTSVSLAASEKLITEEYSKLESDGLKIAHERFLDELATNSERMDEEIVEGPDCLSFHLPNVKGELNADEDFETGINEVFEIADAEYDLISWDDNIRISGILGNRTEDVVASSSIEDRVRAVDENRFIFDESYTFEKVGDAWKCGTCRQLYKSRTNLDTHLLASCSGPDIRTGKTSFVKIGPNEYMYDERYKVREKGEDQFECSVCLAVRTGRRCILRHMRLHLNGNKYKCSTCGKGFARRYLRDEHQRMHTNEKPFVCDSCGRRFSRESGLKNHVNFKSCRRHYVNGSAIPGAAVPLPGLGESEANDGGNLPGSNAEVLNTSYDNSLEVWNCGSGIISSDALGTQNPVLKDEEADGMNDILEKDEVVMDDANALYVPTSAVSYEQLQWDTRIEAAGSDGGNIVSDPNSLYSIVPRWQRRKPRVQSRQIADRVRKIDATHFIFDEKLTFERIGDVWKCGTCGLEYKERRAMNLHLLLSCVGDEKRMKLEKLPDSKFKYRGYTFENVGDQFICSNCEHASVSQGDAVNHIRIHHLCGPGHGRMKKQGLIDLGNDLFQCGDTHQFELVGNDYFKCLTCGTYCHLQESVIEHVKSHETPPQNSGRASFVEISPNVYLYAGKYRVMKTGPDEFKCMESACVSVLGRRGMMRHLFYHLNSGRFSCGACGKAFSRRNRRDDHERLHTSDKSFVCRSCGLNFLSMSKLRNHINEEHDERVKREAVAEIVPQMRFEVSHSQQTFVVRN